MQSLRGRVRFVGTLIYDLIPRRRRRDNLPQHVRSRACVQRHIRGRNAL
jgi:hypothetical protein